MIVANFFVYLPGGIKRDDAKVRAMAQATGLGLYEAKVMLGAPGPRKVGAFATEDDAQAQAVKLRDGGLNAFVIDKARFSRAPKIFKALKAVENPDGLLFSIETAPAPGQVNAQFFDLPQPRGIVQAVVLGVYTETKTHSTGRQSRFSVASSISIPKIPTQSWRSGDPSSNGTGCSSCTGSWATSDGPGWRSCWPSITRRSSTPRSSRPPKK
jgi:hypothetical protein